MDTVIAFALMLLFGMVLGAAGVIWLIAYGQIEIKKCRRKGKEPDDVPMWV